MKQYLTICCATLLLTACNTTGSVQKLIGQLKENSQQFSDGNDNRNSNNHNNGKRTHNPDLLKPRVVSYSEFYNNELLNHSLEEVSNIKSIRLSSGGKTEMLNVDVSDNGLITIGDKNTPSLFWKQNSSFYGAENNGNSITFQVGGKEARNLPFSGAVVYKGKAVGYYGEQRGLIFTSIVQKLTAEGTSKITVDFSNKIVNGTITMPDRTITLSNGTLKGTQYSGFATTSSGTRGEYEGNLYGNNAAETAGIVSFGFSSGKGVAFGGKRD